MIVSPVIVVFGTDLMDQSRLRAALGDVRIGRRPPDAAGADVVIVDLTRFADGLADIRAAGTARLVAYGPHVDAALLASATAAGADLVLPRSRLFRDPAAAVGREPGPGPETGDRA